MRNYSPAFLNEQDDGQGFGNARFSQMRLILLNSTVDRRKSIMSMDILRSFPLDRD